MKTLLITLTLMIAGALYGVEAFKDAGANQRHSVKRSNDTCTINNLPPLTARAPEYNSVESIRTCRIEIADTKDLPSCYAIPSAGWRDFTAENITAIVAPMDSLKELVLITRKCADIEIQRRASSMLYSIFKRNARFESGNRDRYTLQLTSATTNAVRPDYLYWYQSPSRSDPYLKACTPVIFLTIMAALCLVVTGNRRRSFFRFSFFFPPVAVVLITYVLVMHTSVSSATKSFVLFFIPVAVITISGRAGKFISRKTGMILFWLWCFSYLIYRDQITVFFSSDLPDIIFGMAAGTFLLFTLMSMPNRIQGSFRMQLAGIGGGYALLTLHVFFPSLTFYSLAVFLTILSQVHGIGRMRMVP